MANRLRHCVECPECGTRYLIGFSPYCNGSRLVAVPAARAEEYRLICSCSRPAVASRSRWSELKTYAVANAAYARGFGSPEEVRRFS